MSISTIKKILLGGTALVAVSAFGVQAQAAVETLTGAATWGVNGNGIGDSGTGSVAPDTVAGSTFLLTVSNTGAANDGSANTNTFHVGAITGSTGGVITNTGAGAADLAVTIDSAVFTGAAPITVTNAGNASYANATTVTGALSNTGAGTLNVTNASGLTKAVTLTVGGNTTIGGATTITAGTVAGATSTLTLNGATNAFTGAVTLNDGTGSSAQLVLGSTATSDTFTGGLLGAGAGQGTLTLLGNNVISGNVGATSLKLINDTASTGTASISGTTGATTVTNAGAGTLTLTGAVTATTLNENGAGGTINLNAGGANTITTANFGADGTIALGTTAGTISGNVTTTTTNTGTLQLNAGVQTIGGTVGSSTLLLKEVDGGAIGGTSTFTGAVDATLLKVLGTGTVTLNAAAGNNIGTTNFAGDGTVSLITGGTLTGNVTTATTNTGTLTLAGTETVTGNVGTSTVLLKEIKAGAGNAAITGSANATTLLFNGANTVALQGASNTIGTVDFNSTVGTLSLATGASLTGNIDNSGATGGALTLAGGTQTITGTVGATHAIGAITANVAGAVDKFTSTVNAASITGGTGSLIFGGAVTTSGNFVAANTTTLGANTINAGGTFTLATGQTLNVSSAGTATSITSTGAANVAAGSIIDLTTTAGPATVGGIKTYTLVSGATGTVTAAAADNLVVNGVADTAVGTTAFRSGVESYVETVNTIGGDSLVVTATRQATTATATANETSVATALNTIGASTGNLATAITSYTTGSTAAANQVLGSLAPSVTGGAQNTAFEVGSETQDVANVRMSALRDGDDKSGVAAGASANGVSLWLEGYGQHANQDAMDSVAGYSANTWGGVVGVDSTNLLDRSVLGVAFNYGHSKVDADDANNTHTGLDNYGVDLYGTYDLGNKMFVAGQAGYAYNKENTDRYNVGGLGVTASGDTHSDEWTARADLGRNYPMDGGLTLTPDVSANYGYLNTQGYSETGAGNADLNVNSNDQNVLALGVGGTATWKIKDDENIFKPSVHAGYAYNAINDKVQETSSFAAAPGVSFITDGASPARNVFDVGAKLVYETKANWDISATYDFQAKEDYTSHTGEVRATAHF